MIDTLLSCQTVEHGMAATTCRLLHLPLSPLCQTSLDKCCIPKKKKKKGVYACCVFLKLNLKKKLCDACICCFFFFYRTVKFNCSVSVHILIRDGECLTANKPDLQQTSLSLQSISGSPTGPSKQRCSAGGEVEKNYLLRVFRFVSSDINPSLPSTL